MQKLELHIEGMSCHHCVMAVRKALQSVPGVTVLDVQVGKALVELSSDQVSPSSLKAAIENAGYALS